MKEVIQLAIESHRAWTAAFEAALEAGRATSEFSTCAYDDLCPLGKWLYSLDGEIKHSPRYLRVKDLHYRFHVEAGQVLTLLKADQLGAARQRLDADYALVSERLLQALRDWLDEPQPG